MVDAMDRRTAVEFRCVSMSFLKVRNLPEVLLSIPVVNWVAQQLRWMRRFTECKHPLENLSFRITEGTLHGLFGVNGAGKSTAIHLLNGVLEPEAGEVLIYGEDRFVVPHRAREIVSKGAAEELYEHFTPFENLCFTARLFGLDPARTWEVASELLTRLGMPAEDQMRAHVATLSVGNRAKVAIVRALLPVLAPRPNDDRGPILVFDEPSRGLDVVAVEALFTAIREVMAAISRLTVVIATNDPREAAHCDDYTAIVNGHAEHDGEQLIVLRAAMARARNGLTTFARMIGGSANGETHAPLPPVDLSIPRARNHSITFAFWWRSWRDLCSSPALFAAVILSLVIPNMVGLFAAAGRPGGGGLWSAFVMSSLGIYASLIIRESFRFLDRERGYYRMLELVMSSPISRVAHWWAVMSGAIVIHGVTALLTSVALALLLATEPGFADDASRVLGAITWTSAIGVLGVLVLCTVAFLAIGLVASLLPFVMRSDQSYFILSVLPILTVATSGVYYETSVLPPPLRWAAELNPLSYGAHSLKLLLDLPAGPLLPFASAIYELCPVLGECGADLVVLLGLTGVYFVIGVFLFRVGERFLRRIGRLRS